MTATTTTVEVPTPDGTADALLAVPAGDGPHPGVLVYMDAFGLRPRLEEMAARLADLGYVVLVPNVFHRAGPAPVVELPDLSVPANREAVFGELMPLLRAMTPELAARDAGAYLSYLRALPQVTDGPVATVGYCMGAALALRAAAQDPEHVAAVAGFHGARLATDAPDSPHLLADRLRAEAYFGHADHDASMPPEQQERFEAALTEAGVVHRAEQYDGAAHGWTMADTAAYDHAATERHWRELESLLARTLR